MYSISLNQENITYYSNEKEQEISYWNENESQHNKSVSGLILMSSASSVCVST